MDRELPHEHDDFLDRPDPWGDIPDMDTGGEALRADHAGTSTTTESEIAPMPDRPPTPERPRRRRGKQALAAKAPAEPSPPAPADHIPDDIWELPNETTPAGPPTSDVGLAPPAPQIEPTAVGLTASTDFEPARPATRAGDPTSNRVPPWPDRSLDVLPFADRSAWPGVRDQGKPGQKSQTAAFGGPPEPATDPLEADLYAYTLPPPRAAH